MNIHLMVFFGLLVFWIFLFRDIRHSIKSYSKTKKYLIIILPPLLMSSQLSNYLNYSVFNHDSILIGLGVKTLLLVILFAIHLLILKKYA